MRNYKVGLLSSLLPDDLIYVIDKFFPYPKKKKTLEVSPSMQKELKKIQIIKLKNKSSMYMKDLEDFCLD
jgi:hypothetical protein